jgi:hypothetical protein
LPEGSPSAWLQADGKRASSAVPTKAIPSLRLGSIFGVVQARRQAVAPREEQRQEEVYFRSHHAFPHWNPAESRVLKPVGPFMASNGEGWSFSKQRHQRYVPKSRACETDAECQPALGLDAKGCRKPVKPSRHQSGRAGTQCEMHEQASRRKIHRDGGLGYRFYNTSQARKQGTERPPGCYVGVSKVSKGGKEGINGVSFAAASDSWTAPHGTGRSGARISWTGGGWTGR